MHVIPVTWEAEVRTLWFKSSLGKISETLSEKHSKSKTKQNRKDQRKRHMEHPPGQHFSKW
jgi:hypothetical protein